MEKVVLGLGSNIGNRNQFIAKAIKEVSLIRGIVVLGRSDLYRTEPWGIKKQREFVNCVLVCLCKLNYNELFRRVKKIERSLGRKKRPKWAPREIDIDILFFGNHIIKSKLIDIPHPMIAGRNFVLYPLSQLVPDLRHPVLKKKISNLLRHSKDSSKVRIINWRPF